ERVDSSDHLGPLAALQRVSGPVQVLRPALRPLCEATARPYGGTLADVLRLAIPPRHPRRDKAVLKAEKRRTPIAAAAGPASAVAHSSAVSGDPADVASSSLPGGVARLLGRLGRWVVEADPPFADDAAGPRRRALPCAPGPMPGLRGI